MPIVRVPVVHKFGIVSVSRAEQLLKEGRGDKREGNARPVKATAPTKISQFFIEKYNGASGADREKLDRTIQRTFTQAKYKAGLHKTAVRGGVTSWGEEGEGRVCDAWLELILLCQCYGPHQEDVLLALATSLNHAPLSSIHIPSLLYMCGLCYQWLKSDLSVSQTTGQLRTGELMLLRILYLISLRLYYHQMVGTLQDVCTREDIRQLKFDLEGFESRERAYRNFPEALLHWKVALEVGQVVVESNSPVALHEPSDPSILSPTKPSPVKPCSGHSTSTEGVEGREGGRGREVCPLLKHSLGVWRAVRSQGQLEVAISRLSNCPIEFSIDNWMESLLAINVLCLGSQLSLPILTLLHTLATPSPSSPHPPHTSRRHHHHHTPNAPLSTPRSASLFRDTPTVGSQVSCGSASQDESPPDTLPTRKGTRFVLPETESISNTPDLPVVLPGEHRGEVDTLNVLGLQPGFREPYQESVYSDVGVSSVKMSGGAVRDSAGCRVDLESEASQSLNSIPDTVGSMYNSSLQEVNSTVTTLGKTTSLSQSLGVTSSPWLKSTTTSRNWPHDSNSETEGDSVHTPGDRVQFSELDISQLAGDLQQESNSDTTTYTRDKLRGLESTTFTRGESPKRLSELSLGEPVFARSTGLSGFHRNVETRCTHYTHSSSALSGGAGVPGSHVAPSTVYRQSVYSPLTIDMGAEEGEEDHSECGGVGEPTAAASEGAGFESWPSEVGLGYTIGMGEVVLYGRTSGIQLAALEGGGERALGLRQLAQFSLNSPPEESECRAWAVRHCAVLGLSRVGTAHRPLAGRDGLGGVAWSLLMQGHSTERDSRVLEAYRMSQVYPDIDGQLLAVESGPLSSPMLAHIADQLASSLLPPPPLTTAFSSSTSPPKRVRPKAKITSNPPQPSSKVDTRHEKVVCRPSHVGYTARTVGALQGIMERDWKKEMQREREQEGLGPNVEKHSDTLSSQTQ